MPPTRQHAIDTWFDGLNATQRDPIAALFAPHHLIRNAANPPLEGPDAIDRLLGDFYERTTSRHFTLHATANSPTRSFARWTGELTFADGATVAGHTVEAFTITIDGIDIFEFDPSGLISTLDIVHQTTTVAVAAAAHARSTP
jgi:hypothetical protein